MCQANTDIDTSVDLCPDVFLAFDEAVVSDPPFAAVIHTASPYHFNAKDLKKELLDPGITALS